MLHPPKAATDTMPNTTVYSQVGGATIGWNRWLAIYVSIPFGRITVAPEEVTLGISFLGLRKIYRIDREQLCSVAEYHGVFTKGVKLEHNVETYPKFMVFWSSKSDELKANLTRLGYKLSLVKEEGIDC